LAGHRAFVEINHADTECAGKSEAEVQAMVDGIFYDLGRR